MDTKWKKFSRSLVVRVILNGLMIGCLLVEIMLCINIYDTEKKYEKNYRYGYVNNFYGNTELQESFKNAWRGLMEYVIAINSQGISLGKLEEQVGKLNEDQIQFVTEQQKKFIDATGTNEFQYQLTVNDGTDKTISNCTDNPNNLNAFPIYSLYKGYLNENTYIKDWTNYYVDSYTEEYEKDYGYDYVNDTEFQWLEINSIINEICQGNQEYSQYVAKNIVANIQVYKNTVKNCLYYFYDSNSNSTNETTEKSILRKLYGAENRMSVEELMDAICEEFDEDENVLTYEENVGLIYSEYSNTYYYQSEDGEIQYLEIPSQNVLNRLIKELEKQKNEETDPKLTKEETNTLIKTISKAIYIGNNGLTSKVQISIPVAAVLGTPEEYTMYIGVDDALYQTTQGAYMREYAVSKEKTDMIEKQERMYIYACIVVLVFLGFVVLALFYVCGRKDGTEEIQFLAIDAWYTEIQGIFIVLGIIVGTVCLFEISHTTFSFRYYGREYMYTALSVLAFTAFFLIELLCSIVRKIKGGILFRQSILGKIILLEQRKLYHEKLSKRVMICYLVVCIFWLFFEYIALSISIYDEEHWFLVLMQLILVFLLVCTAFLLHRHLQHWEQIRDGVKRIKAGEINYQIPTNDSQKPLNLFAKDINSLSEGLENAVDEMLKSEKLKTELISNVSHDIKTPLTSIITYVDLIKKEDVQPEKVKEYIDVLDQKSQRLKTLTDDLFEAAKATSGAMAMDVTRIDLGSLVNQAIGEFSEKLEKSDLNVRNNIEGDSLFVMADGKLTWRIMENLLGNVSKYALAGSRIYMDATDTGNTILLTVKNISNMELNISAEELMERFTRGDQSRNTEGSGLGLNIAQSLATLQGGKFHVEIDGDLFKAILELPKAEMEII